MGVLSEALQFLGLTAGSRTWDGRPGLEIEMAATRDEQRKLAETMRALPGRFTDRLSARALAQITSAAHAGQWELAIEELITALHARAEMISATERDELRAVLAALHMTDERVEALIIQH